MFYLLKAAYTGSKDSSNMSLMSDMVTVSRTLLRMISKCFTKAELLFKSYLPWWQTRDFVLPDHFDPTQK